MHPYHLSQLVVLCGPLLRFYRLVGISFIALMIFAPPVAALAASSEVNAANLHSKLTRDSAQLLKDIAILRADELDKMQKDIERNLAEWEDDDAEMDGESLRTQLRKAMVVAKSRNLPIGRLTELFEVAKRAILRADYTSLCGGGEDITHTLTKIAKTAEEVVTGQSADHYFTLSDRVEGRMLCEQKKRVAAFKGAWRHYLRALVTPSPKEAADNLRQLADVAIKQLNGAEAAVLNADAKVLTSQLGQVETILESIPMVSDAFDVVNAWNGETLTGEKLSALERSFMWINTLAPNALTMAVGYAGKGVGKVALLGGRITGKSIAFLWKMAVPDKATTALVKSVLKQRNKAGDTMEALSRKAADMLQWAKARYNRGVEEGAKIARRKVSQITDASKYIDDAVDGVVFKNVFNKDGEPLSWIDNADMPGAWLKALSRAAENTNTVLIARPVNPDSKALYKALIASPKPKTIQAKTSELPGIAGFIPTDQAFSKAARDGAEGITKKNKQVAEALARGDAVSKPIKALDGKTVHTAVDAKGNALVLKDMGNGKYIDVNTGKPPKGAIRDVKPMEALCDPHTGKYYTGDLDMVGVGSKQQSGWTYGQGVGATNRPKQDYDPNLPMKNGKVDEIKRMDEAYAGQSGYDEIHGAIQGHEQSVHGEINVFARMEAAGEGMDKASIVMHGGAGRFIDVPEKEGLTIVLPNGKVGTINSHEDLVRVFKACKEQGFKGLEWNPAWGPEPGI